MSDLAKSKMFDKAGFSAFIYRNKKGIASIASIIVGFFISCIAISIMGYNPFELLNLMFTNAFNMELGNFWETLQTFSLLTILGVAVAIGFKAGLFNIGVAGQMVFAAMNGFLFASANPDLDPAIMAIVVVVIAIVSAALFGIIAGLLKAFFGVHEVISTIMLNWIAAKIMFGLLSKSNSPITQTSTGNLVAPSMSTFMESMSENITWILIAAIVAVVMMFVVFKYTKLGMKIKISGNSIKAGKYAGYNSKRIVIGVMTVSAMIAGLAAVAYFFKSGTHLSSMGNFDQGFFSTPPEIGFVGISVALVALNSPLAIMPVAFLFAILQGGPAIAGVGQVYSGFDDIAKIFGAIIVYFVAISNLFIHFVTISKIKTLYKRIIMYYKNDQVKMSSKVLSTILNILSLGIYTHVQNNWGWIEKLKNKREKNQEAVNV